MTAIIWIWLIQTLLSEVKQIWKYADQLHSGQIPSLEELLKQSESLQAKIDAEK